MDDTQIASVWAAVVTSVAASVVAVALAFIPLITWWVKRSTLVTEKKEQTRVNNRRKKDSPDASSEDIFAGSVTAQFGAIPKSIEAQVGLVARLTISAGGYFGLSVTDDGGSCRLAIRHGTLVADRRFYTLGDLEAALSTCYSKLRAVTPSEQLFKPPDVKPKT